MVKKLVRLALSSEYARLPIRRTDISAKVLGEQGTRQFKAVFEGAQQELKRRFGMEMTELPGREKVTLTQRRGGFFLPSFFISCLLWDRGGGRAGAYVLMKIPPHSRPESRTPVW